MAAELKFTPWVMIAFIALLPLSATRTLPLPSTATLLGEAEAAAQQIDAGVAPRRQISFTALLESSATKTLPLPSTATPMGLLNPLPSGRIEGGRDSAADREDLLHRIVAGVGDEDVADGVYCDPLGAAEPAAQRNDA